MVDVSDKADTRREAVAEGLVRMTAETLALLRDHAGDRLLLRLSNVGIDRFYTLTRTPIMPGDQPKRAVVKKAQIAG